MIHSRFNIVDMTKCQIRDFFLNLFFDFIIDIMSNKIMFNRFLKCLTRHQKFFMIK